MAKLSGIIYIVVCILCRSSIAHTYVRHWNPHRLAAQETHKQQRHNNDVIMYNDVITPKNNVQGIPANGEETGNDNSNEGEILHDKETSKGNSDTNEHVLSTNVRLGDETNLDETDRTDNTNEIHDRGNNQNSPQDASSFIEDDPGRRPLSEILMYLRMLSQDMSSLRIQLSSLKHDNHLLYKQMKRALGRCTEEGSNDVINTQNDALPLRAAKPAAISSLDLSRDYDIEPCPTEYTWAEKLFSCYRLVAERVSWKEARDRCQRDGADLVAIESDREQRLINRLASEETETRHCDFWTSGSDVQREGSWQWLASNRPLTYHNWHHGEPNSGGAGQENCLQLLWVFNWAWNDAQCATQKACFICELPRHGK